MKVDIKAEKRFFQKVDRILSQRETIRIRQGRPKTDTRNYIWLPFRTIANDYNDYFEYLKTIKGINYHELAHVLWSKTSKMEQINIVKANIPYEYWVSDIFIAEMVNRIEDCRIETKFVLTFPSSRNYFSRVVYHALKKNPKNISFFDIYGRKYLDKELRKKYIKEFMKKPYGKKVKDLIDDYILENDGKKGAKIIAKIITELIKNNKRRMKQNKMPYSDSFGKGYVNTRLGDRKEEEVEKSLKELVDEEEEIEEEVEEDAKIFSDDDVPDDEFATPDKPDLSDELSDPDNSDKIEGTDDVDEEEVDDLIHEIDDDVEEEIVEDVNVIKGGGGYSPWSEAKKNPTKFRFDMEKNKDYMNKKSRQIERVIHDMRLVLREHWLRGQRTGRVEISRAMSARRNGNMRFFKRFQQDITKETRLATAILIDRSGSMIGDLSDALMASWCISNALMKTNNNVIEIAFNNRHKILKGWGENSNYEGIKADGSTDPASSLNIAYLKLSDIKQYDSKLIPLIIVITDGQYTLQKDWGAGKKIIQIKKEFPEAIFVEINLFERASDSNSNMKNNFYDYVEYCPDIGYLHKKMQSILEKVEYKFLENRL